MYNKSLSFLVFLLVSIVLTSCQSSISLSDPIDTSTPKGKVILLKRQIVVLENRLSNAAKDGAYLNITTYLQGMSDRVEKVKTHVDASFHSELDVVIGLYSVAIKDYKKTKSYLLVENKFKRGKKKLRKVYKKIMLSFDKKEVDEKDNTKKVEKKK